jgi:hypothetical protein
MVLQRYVSKELTHFVGRNSPEERYSILVNDIIRGGWLKTSTTIANNFEPEETLETGTLGYGINPSAPLGEMYLPRVVSFGDIPIDDLEIHMQKYSRFGLSFLKSFLIEKGANPVFYIARNAKSLDMTMEKELVAQFGKKVPREPLFQERLRTFQHLFKKLLWDNRELFAESHPDRWTEEQRKLNELKTFLEIYVFSFLKDFKDGTVDEDLENFYMEREWRVFGDVHFEPNDVYRIILPPSYGKRLRDDLPQYFGQVTFVGD